MTDSCRNTYHDCVIDCTVYRQLTYVQLWLLCEDDVVKFIKLYTYFDSVTIFELIIRDHMYYF
jgi:hypothetical protein